MNNGYKWRPIKDLPGDWGKLADPDLKALAKSWLERRPEFEPARLHLIVERLNREWAIETGQLEGLYFLDRGLTQTLVEYGLDAIDIPSAASPSPLKTKRLIKNQKDVVEGLFSFIKGDQPLSCHYIRALHAELTREQETTESLDSQGRIVDIKLLKGTWKILPNNPTRPGGLTHEYCPPEHVQSEMDMLLLLHQDHVVKQIPPEVEAAWLHHCFTQIHPFQDGNGRMARTLATLIFLQAQWFPLVVTMELRKIYIDALETADRGDLAPLVTIFATIASKIFQEVLGAKF